MSHPVKRLLTFGVVLALGLLAFQKLYEPYTTLKMNQQGITQVKLDLDQIIKQEKANGADPKEKIKILDEQGKLKFNGWSSNIGDKFEVNYQDATTPFFSKDYSYMKYRSWNFVMLYLPTVIVQIPISNFWPACVTSVQVYPRDNPKTMIQNRKVQEFFPLLCPNISLDSTEWSNKTKIQSGDFIVEVLKDPKREGILVMNINAPAIQFKAKLDLQDSQVDDQFYLMPVTDNKQLYFANKKKFGIPTLGDYEYQGKKYHCGQKQDGSDKCLSLYDNGRAHFKYHTNWYWASFTAYLPKLQKTVSINMGDGIGIDFNPLDGEKFYEDFITIDGKLFKLDQTAIDFQESDFTKTHAFKTVSSSKVFPERSCDLKFQPVGTAKDGVHLIVFGVIQHLVYGMWSGTCLIDGQNVTFDNVIGTVEHIRARW
eukprot:403370742